LTVETFWRIYRSRGHFDLAHSFAAWARRIATNASLDYLRTARARGRTVELSDNFSAGPPADPALTREVREKIVRCFNALPPKLRAVATLALIEERPHADIAEALGISVGTVRVRVFRAVRRLRELLQDAGVTP
jgi:RNA polymerase sigma-70 factor (ECF subfamily)